MRCIKVWSEESDDTVMMSRYLKTSSAVTSLKVNPQMLLTCFWVCSVWSQLSMISFNLSCMSLFTSWPSFCAVTLLHHGLHLKLFPHPNITRLCWVYTKLWPQFCCIFNGSYYGLLMEPRMEQETRREAEWTVIHFLCALFCPFFVLEWWNHLLVPLV